MTEREGQEQVWMRTDHIQEMRGQGEAMVAPGYWKKWCRSLVELNPPPIQVGMWVQGGGGSNYIAQVLDDGRILIWFWGAGSDRWMATACRPDGLTPCDPPYNAQALYDLLGIEGPT